MHAFVLLVAFLISLAAPARAADDVAAAQGVIRSQVEAFSRDDAAAAYSHAAPAIQEIFPQADIFMSMVRNSYAPVYRHKSFDFGEARVADGTIVQRIHIVDADGIPWVWPDRAPQGENSTGRRQLSGTLDIENVQYRAVGGRSARTPGHRRRQQTFEFL